MTELALNFTILDIVKARDQALVVFNHGVDLVEEGYARTRRALEDVAGASGGIQTARDYKSCFFKHVDNATDKHFDPEQIKVQFRAETDRRCWLSLLEKVGIRDIMDAEAIEKFRKDVSGDDCPVFNVDNSLQTFKDLVENADEIFSRGLANAFVKLDPRFKSHDAFGFKSRIIVKVRDNPGAGGGYNRSRALDTLEDIERVLITLAKKGLNPGDDPPTKEIRAAVRTCQLGETLFTRFFKLRTFKNGNAHLYFRSKRLVEKINEVLAQHYGKTLPDSPEAAQEKAHQADLLVTDLAANLSFYPTPDTLGEELLSNTRRRLAEIRVPEGAKVLEPSAGDGSLVAKIINANTWGHGQGVPAKASVTAVEVDQRRANSIRLSPDMPAELDFNRLRVIRANFLELRVGIDLADDFDLVIMNPPFYGTHWMAHVMKAFEFLKPGGYLYSILPATAQIGPSNKHITFRKWLADNTALPDYRPTFIDLPPGSFKESGTNISTVLLQMRK